MKNVIFAFIFSFTWFANCKPAVPKDKQFGSFFEELKLMTKEKVSLKLGEKMKASEKEFLRMKSYLIQYYEGAEVKNTFLENGVLVDCHTFESQPGMRNLSLENKNRGIKIFNEHRAKSRSQNLLVLKLGNYDMSEWTSIIQQSLINFGNV